MTIRHFILGASEPEAIAAMSEALEAAWKRFQDTGPPGEGDPRNHRQTNSRSRGRRRRVDYRKRY